jgi:hypothetical protein
MSEDQGFKRINFFKGFVTTTKDWNDAEFYHVEKRKLHNRCFHGAGVVPGFRQEFKVRARGRGDLSVEISPGYALDGQGNDLLLWETEIKTLNKGDYKLPQTIYVVAKYVEEYTDFVAYKENLDFKGHRRILERAKIDFTITKPDIRNEVELARVYVTADAKQIIDARDPAAPNANEIDLRYVPWAGVAGGHIQSELYFRFKSLLQIQRQFFSTLARDKKVLSANAVSLSIMTLEMLMESGQVGPQNIMGLLRHFGELEWEVVREIEATKPAIKAKKEFGQFKHSVEVFRGLLSENPKLIDDAGYADFEALDQILGFQEKGGLSLGKISGDPLTSADESVASAPLAGALGGEGDPSKGDGWDDVKVMSQDLPDTLTIEGVVWTRVDLIDILDAKTEASHSFQIQEARDSWRTRQRLRYPDGTVVEDSGIAHEGGYATWVIQNVTPHRPLAIIRRMDYVRGDYEVEYFVNGTRVGSSQCPGNDRKFRWRNWPFVIGEKNVTSNQLTVKQVATSAERDINMFKLWFYQAL